MDEEYEGFSQLLDSYPKLSVADFEEDKLGLLRLSINLNPAMVAKVTSWSRSKYEFNGWISCSRGLACPPEILPRAPLFRYDKHDYWRAVYTKGLQQPRDYLVARWPNDGLKKWENRPHEIKECKQFDFHSVQESGTWVEQMASLQPWFVFALYMSLKWGWYYDELQHVSSLEGNVV